MPAALDTVSSSSEPDYRHEELLPHGKAPAFRLQTHNLKRLLLFYILREEFRSYIGLHKFPGEKKLLCVYLLENKTIVFLLRNSSYNRCENKYT